MISEGADIETTSLACPGAFNAVHGSPFGHDTRLDGRYPGVSDPIIYICLQPCRVTGSWQRRRFSAAGNAREKCRPRISGRSHRSWFLHSTGTVTDIVPRVFVARVKFFAESLTLQTPVLVRSSVDSRRQTGRKELISAAGSSDARSESSNLLLTYAVVSQAI